MQPRSMRYGRTMPHKLVDLQRRADLDPVEILVPPLGPGRDYSRSRPRLSPLGCLRWCSAAHRYEDGSVWCIPCRSGHRGLVGCRGLLVATRPGDALDCCRCALVDRVIGSGLGLRLERRVLTRPHTAVVAAGTGLISSWQNRSLCARRSDRDWCDCWIGRAGRRSMPSCLEPLDLRWVHEYVRRAGDQPRPVELGKNIMLALVDPARGLLVYSPFLILAAGHPCGVAQGSRLDAGIGALAGLHTCSSSSRLTVTQVAILSGDIGIRWRCWRQRPRC